MAGFHMLRRNFLGGSVALGASIASLRPSFAEASGPIVETVSGKLRGAESQGVAVFKGIPYADSAAGENRFRPPRPAPRWAGIRDALVFGPNAPQIRPAAPGPAEFAWYWADLPQSEDSLTLSVYTPGLREGRRPVLLWLHGGAFSVGTGSAPGFDGSYLAKAQNVVVVSINHRLNLFGSFFLGDEQNLLSPEAGNLAVLDQIAALRWVRDNIAAFGGDADNVTIFGQSGGAAKVATLLAAPAAAGLFHRAVVQSASGAWRLAKPEAAARSAHAVLKELGLQAREAAKLRDVPHGKLLEALAKVGAAEFRPTLDDVVFRQHPFDPAASTIGSRVPVLIGWTSDEATFFLAGDPRNFSLSEAQLRARTKKFLKLDDEATDAVLAGYRERRPKATASELLIAVAGDYNYRLPTALVADRQAAAGAPVYAYQFNWRSPARAGALGAPHTGEVPFIFGTLDAAAPLVAGSPDATELRDRLGEIWGSFARSGAPTSRAIGTWQPYTTQERAVALIGAEWRVAKDPLAEERRAIGHLPAFEYSFPVSFVQD